VNHMVIGCGEIEKQWLAFCIFVMNSSRALNIACMALAGEGGSGIHIEAQKICWRSGVCKSWATSILENNIGQKNVWPGLKDISPSVGPSSSSPACCMKSSRCLPSSSFSLVSIWFKPFDNRELLGVLASLESLLYWSPGRFAFAAAMVAREDIMCLVEYSICLSF